MSSGSIRFEQEACAAGAVRALFEIRRSRPGYVYDVTADGQRFLVNTAVEQKESAPITLVINWTADLKR